MNNDLITALVDNEISDKNLIQRLNEQISYDPSLKYDYNIQLFCKKIVTQRVKKVSAPQHLRSRIISEIMPKELEPKKKHNFLLDIFYRPSFSFATAIIIVVAIILITINRNTQTSIPEIDLANLTPDNMFLQAVNNYSSILKGQLTPQFLSDNSKEICNYFSKNGVSYSTIVPEFKEWKLLGAVISEDKGTKLAHHVYVGNNNQIIYVFQVNKSYINNLIELDPELVNYLDSGNCYSKEINGNLVLFSKMKQNICAVIANGDFNYVKNNFCSLN